MRRRTRVLLALASALLALGLSAGLVLLGERTHGPVTATLERASRALARLEASFAERLRGPGRRAELAWFAPYREDSRQLANPDTVLLGAYQEEIPGSLEGLLELERELGITLPLIHAYVAWGDAQDQQFPHRFLEAVNVLGSVGVVTWEPWLAAFESRLHPHLPLRTERDRGGLAAVAEGAYDDYVDRWAREAAAHGRPILLRFAHEMNDPYRYPWGPQNNHPFDFIAAWRHVVGRFRAAGADNVLWVWSPHVAYEGYEWFYPGDEHVDWVATGALNYGTVARWSEWWWFSEIFGDRYAGIAAFGKPVMVAELGSLAVGGDRATWYRRALADLPARYPALAAVLFFEVSRDATVTYQALDWSLSGQADLVATVRDAIREWGPPYAAAPAPASPSSSRIDR
jgi:hypothetical protein